MDTDGITATYTTTLRTWSVGCNSGHQTHSPDIVSLQLAGVRAEVFFLNSVAKLTFLFTPRHSPEAAEKFSVFLSRVSGVQVERELM